MPEDPLEPDVPVVPLEPEVPLMPEDPLVPEEPEEPEDPLEPELPLEPEVDVYATAATPTFFMSTIMEGAAGLKGEDCAPNATNLMPALLAENAISM